MRIISGFLNPKERGKVVVMAKVGSVVIVNKEDLGLGLGLGLDLDMEEGEISDDSMSIEEISEEDFKKEANFEVLSKSISNSGGDSRAWMNDLMNYSVSGNNNNHNNYNNINCNYSPAIHNFAWRSAVSNKPLLKEFMVRDFDEKSESESKSKSKGQLPPDETVVIYDSSSEESESRMDGIEKEEEEEGELEEGEIELDVVGIVEEEVEKGCNKDDNLVRNLEFDKRVELIEDGLKTITLNEAQKSFAEVCSQIWTYSESLSKMLVENRVPAVESLIQQSFGAIKTVNSVFSSMTMKDREQNKIGFKRLLAYVKSQSDLFPPDCMQEIEAMIHSLDFPYGKSSVKDNEREALCNRGVNLKRLETFSENNTPGHSLKSLKKLDMNAISVKRGNQFERNMGTENLKTGIWSGSKRSGGFGALFDLHKDHDADSLPSPTRDTPTAFSVKRPLVVQETMVKSDTITSNVAVRCEEDAVMLRPYETDALKAVSTYQQKFGRSSFLSSNLPSPTPSGEVDNGDGDSNEEVSSSYAASNGGGVVNPPVSAKAVDPVPPHLANSNGHNSVAVKTAGQLTSDLRPVLRGSARSRDPRLQFANPEVVVRDVNISSQSMPSSQPIGGMMTPRKRDNVEESVMEGRSFKRQRNGLTGLEGGSMVQPQPVVESRKLSGNMESDLRRVGNGEMGSGTRQHAVPEIHNFLPNGGNVQLPVSSNTVSLPSSTKDIAVNPTLLVHLIMEHQRLVANSQPKSGDSAQTATSPSNPGVVGTVPLLNVAAPKSLNTEQNPIVKPQSTTQTVQMNPQSELGKLRMKPRDPRRILHNSTFQQNDSIRPEQFKTIGTPSSITQAIKDYGPLGQNVDNKAQPVPAQPTSVKMDKAELATDSNEQQSRNSLTPEGNTKGPCQSQNAWGEMEHLFEGYDDHQKATIQRERTRRLEEQNKMFAAKKLCLVLDLDHTLLNSAKFVEVDPVHQDKLRVMEEQDRGKPKRHLFRFPHMGMWTKLRPGVWSFLEKANKLFELHLYTMGNKRYATEMAKVLDPTGALFAGRIISRGDDGESLDGEERVPKIKDLDGVMGLESAVVIIDDSVKVWPHNRLNLIAVERYIYFPCSRRQFGLPGPSLLEINHDERSEDGSLATCFAVIEQIHRTFFSHKSLNDLDVRTILASEQRKILAGCRIVFSRVFPVGVANPEQHPLWQTAEQFGAVCTNQIDEQVTHVVANAPGTDKVNWALSTGRFVVHTNWVEASALLYRRAKEHDFAIKV